jgi:hypothetical protein
MNPTMSHPRLAFNLLLSSLALAPLCAHANDFPTVDRVQYVQECMRDHPGPHFEMVNKCSCAVDKLASEVSYDDYVTMSTAANAVTIGGERGASIRDAESMQVLSRKYKALQIKVKKSCFVLPPG